MPQRDSQRAQAPMKGAPSLITQGLGRVSAQSQQGMFDTHVAADQIMPVADSRKGTSPLLGQVLNSLGTMADAAVERSRRQAYLDGATKAGVGESEAALNQNILTRAWAVAGHRDTVGSIALSEYEASIARALPQLREQGPEAMQEYLRGTRVQVMDSVQAMTAEGRENALTQLLTIDRKALAQHNVEHSKFIADQRKQAKTARLNVGLDGLNSTVGTPAYTAARDSAFTAAMSEINFDPSLTTEQKSSMTVEYLEMAMDQGHLSMYELFRTYPVLPDGSGGHFSVSQLMDFKDQVKLSKAYDSARSKHENAASKEMWDTLSSMNKATAMGEYVPYEDYKSHLDQMAFHGFLTNSQVDSRLKSHALKAKEAAEGGRAARSYVTGNIEERVALGISDKQSRDAAEGVWRKSGITDPTTIADMHLRIGIDTGNASSMERVGELLIPAMTAFMQTDKENISPQQVALVQSVYSNLEGAEVTGKNQLRMSLLGAMNDEQKSFMSNTLHYMGEGFPPEHAVAKARERHVEYANMSGPARQQKMQEQQVVNQNILSKMKNIRDEYNPFRLIMGVMPWTDEAKVGGFRPAYQAGGSNPQVMAKELDVVTNELGRELESLDRANQTFISEDAKLESAAANLQKRVIEVPQPGDFGLNSVTRLILPKNTDPIVFFGVDSEYASSFNVEHLGEALGNMTIREGENPHYTVHDGMLHVSYYNKRGDSQPTLTTIIDPQEVAQAAMMIRQKGAADADQVYGGGKMVPGPDGAEVRFNGVNTAGIPEAHAFYVRDSLVQVEGVRNTPYKDGGGYSVGVGINTSNPKYYPDVKPGGVIDNATISSSFQGVSDYMLGKAQHYVNESGIQTDAPEALLALTTHMYYQTSPKAFAQDISPIYEAILDQDLNAAMDALEKSRAYIGAKPHSERGGMYRQWLQDLIKPKYR